MNAYRTTIAHSRTLQGVGLHLGHECRLVFRPAPPGTGRVFVRTDRPGSAPISATADVAVLAPRRTQLGDGDAALHTVEHVLAAVAGLDIDDLIIELDAPEPPVLDGSAAPFLEALCEAGRVESDQPAPVLQLERPVRIEDGESLYEAHPADRLELDVCIDFPHPLVGRQALRIEVTPASFAAELAPARTFGFVHEVESLRAMGLARGGSTANAIVLDAQGVVENELRWADEFVRHKALDCVGDLALAGARVQARVVAHRPSHRGTVQLVREMLRNRH